MNATVLVAKHLQVSHWQVTRVEEWAKVLFAVIKGLGARFVSKRVLKMERKEVTHSEYCSAIAKKVNERSKDYNQAAYSYLTAAIWAKKEGETRVYINGGKGKGFGCFIAYAHEHESGGGSVRYDVKSYIQDWMREIVEEVNKEYKLAPTPQKAELVSNDALTSYVTEMCWQCHYNVGVPSFNGLCVSCVD